MGPCDDNPDVTLVIAVQVVVAALGAALLFERWSQHDETQLAFTPMADPADTIEFHPELIVRWDDEAHAVATPNCVRRSASRRRARARTQTASPRVRSFIR